jgi:hypothetical protein
MFVLDIVEHIISADVGPSHYGIQSHLMMVQLAAIDN